jgi:hypothetical protein
MSLHQGELKRYCVPVRCASHPKIWKPSPGVMVFATSIRGAKFAAVEKMADKYL